MPRSVTVVSETLATLGVSEGGTRREAVGGEVSEANVGLRNYCYRPCKTAIK